MVLVQNLRRSIYFKNNLRLFSGLQPHDNSIWIFLGAFSFISIWWNTKHVFQRQKSFGLCTHLVTSRCLVLARIGFRNLKSLVFLCSIWKPSKFCLSFSLLNIPWSHPFPPNQKLFSPPGMLWGSQLQALTGNFGLSLGILNFRRTLPFPPPLFQEVLFSLSFSGHNPFKYWEGNYSLCCTEKPPMR